VTPSDPPTAPAPGPSPATGPATPTSSPTVAAPVTDAQLVRTAAVTPGAGAGLMVGLLVTGALASLGALAGRFALARRGLR
jgi:hypothetical protein